MNRESEKSESGKGQSRKTGRKHIETEKKGGYTFSVDSYKRTDKAVNIKLTGGHLPAQSMNGRKTLEAVEIYSDIGTPKSSWSPDGQTGEFDIYNYVKTELVKSAIPAHEIAFIHDAKSDAQREALFKDMRTGKKKILIGSTDKCGTGVNVQTHLVAMHHIDCPWKPSSIEQREGRGIRQGNENSEIAIYRYVTKGTFDAYSWSLVENKQRFISQVMTSKSVSRTCEDIDEATLSYAEIKAVATGNPLIREKMELDNDVQRLKLLKASYDSQRYGLQDNFIIRFPKLIKAAEEKLNCVREDIRMRDEQLINAPQLQLPLEKQHLRNEWIVEMQCLKQSVSVRQVIPIQLVNSKALSCLLRRTTWEPII